MASIETTNRIELAVQVALPVELGMVCVHALFPGLAFLPLGGSEIAQVALVIVPALVIAEIFHWGRLVWEEAKRWWRGPH
ncbi:hypothetical protein SR39_31600 [Methylobacterium radiotolerans]|jgi:hypothetical protein|nr:hypothetical protein SR39_31600 [Methylobacterium radiotolerans]